MIDNSIFIPKLIEKTNIELNPLFLKIKEKSNDYIKKKLDEDYLDINLAYWSNICYPNITNEQKLYNITNFFILLFIIDDKLENNNFEDINSKRYINILKNIIKPNTNLENTFKDVCESIKIDLSFAQQKRFLDYIQEWMDGAVYLAKIKNNINCDEYLYFRFKSIGANSSFIIIEYAFNINFESNILNDIKDIHKIAGENIILVNDLFSYRKEIYENKYNPNIIDIIIKQKKCNLQKSIDILTSYIKENFKKFDIIYNRLMNKYKSDQLKTYLNELLNLIYGNLQWSCISPRYHGDNFNNTLINGAKVIFDKNKTIVLDP